MVSTGALAEGKKQIETSLQKLHDQGKWKWLETKVLTTYLRPSLEKKEEDMTGSLYLFKVN